MKYRQFRISIPSDDPVSQEWCSNQGRSLSLALRQLIQREVRKNGTKNVFATTLNESEAASEPVRKPLPKKQVSKPRPANTQTNQSQTIDDDLNNMMM